MHSSLSTGSHLHFLLGASQTVPLQLADVFALPKDGSARFLLADQPVERELHSLRGTAELVGLDALQTASLDTCALTSCLCTNTRAHMHAHTNRHMDGHALAHARLSTCRHIMYIRHMYMLWPHKHAQNAHVFACTHSHTHTLTRKCYANTHTHTYTGKHEYAYTDTVSTLVPVSAYTYSGSNNHLIPC